MMNIVLIILFLFLLIRLLTAFVNFITFNYLPKKIKNIHRPWVSILIPARNEEKNIGNLLGQLQEFNYDSLEIIVCDDHSTDGTASIIQSFETSRHPVQYLKGQQVPIGWLGKNYACHQLANKAKGEYLLFIDADVQVGDGLIEATLTVMQKHKLQLLSIFPKQLMNSWGEQITVPLMNWILLSFLPLPLIRLSKNPAFAAANGQFMLFDSQTYKTLYPHQAMKGNRVEDIAINIYYKKEGRNTHTLLGDSRISCRMYNGFSDSVAGFTKNIFQFFGNSMLLTILVGLITISAPFYIFVFFGIKTGLLYVLGMILIRVFVSLCSKQNPIQNLLLMPIQHLVFLWIIVKGIFSYNKKELLWKGRNILDTSL